MEAVSFCSVSLFFVIWTMINAFGGHVSYPKLFILQCSKLVT